MNRASSVPSFCSPWRGGWIRSDKGTPILTEKEDGQKLPQAAFDPVTTSLSSNDDTSRATLFPKQAATFSKWFERQKWFKFLLSYKFWFQRWLTSILLQCINKKNKKVGKQNSLDFSAVFNIVNVKLLMLVDTQKLVGGGYPILPFLVHFSLKTAKKVLQITFGWQSSTWKLVKTNNTWA